MAEADNQLQKPAGVNPPAASEPIIHVMPAEFRAGKIPMSAPPKLVVTTSPIVPPPVAPAPIKPPVTASKLSAKKRRLPPVLIIGLIVFAAIALGAGALLLTLNKPAANVAVNTNTVNTQPVTPKPECSDTDPCGTGEECSASGKCVAVKPPEPVVPTGGADTDSDGLTDVEEVLFGSDLRNADSDSDTYLDGNEVYHLYNPRASAPGLLVDTGFAREFTTETFDFTIVYPSRWTVQLLADDAGALFKVPTGEYVQVSRQSKDPSVDVASWYLTQAPEAKASEVTVVTTRQGYAGILSPDNMSTYLDFGDHVYVLSYSLGSIKTINFLTTYQMMVNSFVIKD